MFYDENVGGYDRDGVGGDVDQNQDKPGKLLGQGWGGEGALAPAILTSKSDCIDFNRISLLVTLYFIALDFPYL